jgi:hypothetical protein
VSFFLGSAIATFFLVTLILQSQAVQRHGFSRWMFGSALIAILDRRVVLVLVALWAGGTVALAGLLIVGVAVPEQMPLVLQSFASPQHGAMWLGLLAGWLFALLFNRLARRVDGQVTVRDRIEFAMLLVLTLIGVFGEEALRSLANRLTSLKFSGASFELGLSDKGRDSAGSRSNAVIIPQSGKSDFNAPETSQALSLLATLDSVIKRDIEYLQLFEPERKDLNESFRNARTLAERVVKPMARCLTTYARYTADVLFINQRMAGVLDILRQALTLDIQSVAKRNEFVNLATVAIGREQAEMARLLLVTGLVEDLRRFLDHGGEVDWSCEMIILQICDPDIASLVNAAKPGKIAAQYARFARKRVRRSPRWVRAKGECLRWLNTVDAPGRPRSNRDGLIIADPDRNQRISARLSKTLRGMWEPTRPNAKVDDRPYLLIIYCAIMAHLDRYPGGLAVLDRWLLDPTHKPPLKDLEGRWLRLRALSTLTVFTEEWIRRQPDGVPLALRDYHINNLVEMTRGLREMPADAHTTMIAQIEKSAGIVTDLERETFRSSPKRLTSVER